jgi:hypothetical protein
MNWNLVHILAKAIEMTFDIKFEDQIIGSAWNGAHWVRITSYDPYDLKFGIWDTWGTRL